MVLNIFSICPSPTDATSFYRGMGPLGALKRSSKNAIQISILPQVDWSMLKLIDCMFMQRPWKDQDVEFIRRAKAMSKPVWVDYDDDLLHVLPDNPAFKTYNNPSVQKNIAQCISMADHVTVATEKLQELFKPIARRIEIVPNALDDELFGKERQKNSDKKHVLWRGSNTHHRDLEHFGDQLIKVAAAHPEWTFTFVGYNPWWITEKMAPNQAVIVDAMDPIDYFAFMRKVGPRIVIVPLYPSEFNASKSNIGWIEGSYAGAAVLGPDMPEWKRPGIVNYKTPEDFGRCLTGMMSAQSLESSVESSWSYIQDNLLLTNVNQKRMEVVEFMIGCLSNDTWKTEAREGRGDRAIQT